MSRALDTSNSHPSEEALSAYCDDDLGDVERESIERHLRGCEKCGTIVARVKWLSALARKLIDPPMVGRLRAQLEQDKAWDHIAKIARMAAAAAAAAVVIP